MGEMLTRSSVALTISELSSNEPLEPDELVSEGASFCPEELFDTSVGYFTMRNCDRSSFFLIPAS